MKKNIKILKHPVYSSNSNLTNKQITTNSQRILFQLYARPKKMRELETKKEKKRFPKCQVISR